jgi:hypothetical protein
MYQLASGALNLTGKNKLNAPVTCPDKGQHARLHFLQLIQFSNSGGAYTLTQADMLALFNVAIHDTFNLWFGDKAKDQVDQGLFLSDLRELLWTMTYRDFAIRTADSLAGILGDLFDYSAQCSYAVTVPNGGGNPIGLDIVRSFVVEGEGTPDTSQCPGATMMKQVYFEWNSQLATWSANGGAVKVSSGNYRLLTDIFDGDDVWVPGVRMAKLPNPALLNVGPGGGGKLLAVFEQTAPAAASALVNTLSLTRMGDEDIHTGVYPQDLVAEQAGYLDPLGAYMDLNQLVTCLFRRAPEQKIRHLPSNENFAVLFTKADLATFNMAWVYVPTTDDAKVALISKNCTETPNGKGSEVLLTGHGGYKGRTKSGPAAATDGIAIVTPDDPKHAVLSGMKCRPNLPPEPSIPAPIAGATHKAVKATSGHPSGTTVAARRALEIAGQIPGASHPTRGKVYADKMASIHSTIHPDGANASGPASMQNIARLAR